MYAGIYAYGKYQTTQKLVNGRLHKVSKRVKKEKLHAYIPDHHEGYISQEQYDRIEKMLSENNKKASGKGHAGRGPALLAGLLRCKKCGRKLSVAYTGSAKNSLRYQCVRGYLDVGLPKCIGFGGLDFDAAVAEEIFKVLAQPAIEATRDAWEKLQAGEDDKISALKLQLQELEYRTQRAFKQYDAAEPENRLVVTELEKRWNACLQNQIELQNKLEKMQANSNINVPDWKKFSELSGHLHQIFNSEKCNQQIKKRIIRTLINEIVIDIDKQTQMINATIHWNGGIHSQVHAKTRSRGRTRASTDQNIVQAVRELALICDDDIIASYLNKNGVLTGKGNRWTKQRVASLRSSHKIKRKNADNNNQPRYLNLTNTAKYLGVTTTALRRAVDQKEISAKHPLPDGPWIFDFNDLDTEKTKAMVKAIKLRFRGGKTHSDKTLNLFK